MSGPKLVVAICVLAPVAAALLVNFVRSSSSSSNDSSANQEAQPVAEGRPDPRWTHQALREHLDDLYGARRAWSRRSPVVELDEVNGVLRVVMGTYSFSRE